MDLMQGLVDFVDSNPDLRELGQALAVKTTLQGHTHP
jgi:hypothetical protein